MTKKEKGKDSPVNDSSSDEEIKGVVFVPDSDDEITSPASSLATSSPSGTDSKTPSPPNSVVQSEEFRYEDLLDAVSDGELKKFVDLINHPDCDLSVEIDDGGPKCVSLAAFIDATANHDLYHDFFEEFYNVFRKNINRYLIDSNIDQNFRDLTWRLVDDLDFTKLLDICNNSRALLKDDFCSDLVFFLTHKAKNESVKSKLLKIFDFFDGISDESRREGLKKYFVNNVQNFRECSDLLIGIIHSNDTEILSRFLDLVGFDEVKDRKISGISMFFDDLMECAVVRCGYNAIDVLCEKGWDLSKKYPSVNGGNILHIALRQKNVGSCRRLLKNDFSLAFEKNDDDVQPIDLILNKGISYAIFQEIFAENIFKLREFANFAGFADLRVFGLMKEFLNGDVDFSLKNDEGKALPELMVEDFLNGSFGGDEGFGNFIYFASLMFLKCDDLTRIDLAEKFPDLMGDDFIRENMLPFIENAVSDPRVFFTKKQAVGLLNLLDRFFLKDFCLLGEVYSELPKELSYLANLSNLSCDALDHDLYDEDVKSHYEKINKITGYATMFFLNADLLLRGGESKGCFEMLNNFAQEGEFVKIVKERIESSVLGFGVEICGEFLNFLSEDCDLDFSLKLISGLASREGFVISREGDYKVAINILSRVMENEGDSIFDSVKSGESFRLAVRLSESFPEFDVALDRMGDENRLVKELKGHFGIGKGGGRIRSIAASDAALQMSSSRKLVRPQARMGGIGQ